jgi:hypothetical protein
MDNDRDTVVQETLGFVSRARARLADLRLVANASAAAL